MTVAIAMDNTAENDRVMTPAHNNFWAAKTEPRRETRGASPESLNFGVNMFSHGKTVFQNSLDLEAFGTNALGPICHNHYHDCRPLFARLRQCRRAEIALCWLSLRADFCRITF